MHRTARAAGFTLIEMLVSVAIGAAICTTAFMAVRVAGQAVTIGNRLSLENQLLRAGVQAGLDELETWRHYDDPSAPTQPLRADAHPFNPLTQGEDLNFDYNPVRDPTASYEEWWRRDSRCWFRSDPNRGISSVGDHAMGDYSLFGTVAVDPTDTTVLGGAEKRWRHRLVKELSQHQGYFALIDYAPPSLLYHYYDESGTTPDELRSSNNGGIGRMFATTWQEDKPHDFVALTTGTFFTIAVPTLATDAVHRVADINRAFFLTWLNFDTGGAADPGWSVDDAYTSCGGRVQLLPLRPAGWPEPTLTVRHYASNARQFHSATVMTRSPVTAQVFKLYFTYTGTTLRGARRARGLDGSWP